MRFKKNLIIALVILAFLTVGYFLSSHFLGKKAWNSFTLAMNTALGENTWKARDHSFSLFRQTLVIYDFDALWGDPSILNPKLSLKDARTKPEGVEAGETEESGEGTPPAEGDAPEGESSDDGTESDSSEADSSEAPAGDDAQGAPEGEGDSDEAEESGEEAEVLVAQTSDPEGDEAIVAEELAVPTLPSTLGPDGTELMLGGELSCALHIVKIEIKGGLSEVDLGALLTLTDWKSPTAKKIFDKLGLNLITVNIADKVMTIDLVVESIAFGEFTLNKAEDEADTGIASFVKHASLESANLKNFKSFHRLISNPTLYQTTAIEKINIENPQLDEQLVHLTNIPEVFLNLSSSNIDVANFWVNLTFNREEIFKVGFGRVKFDNLATPGLTDKLQIAKLQYKEFVEFRDEETQELVSFNIAASLEELQANKLDMFNLLNRAKLIVESLQTDYYTPSITRVLSDLFRTSDVFTLPVGLTDATFSGFKLVNTTEYIFSIDKINLNGPFVANVLPEKGTIIVDGVKLSFPENLEDGQISLHLFERFRQFAKIPEYTVNFELNLNCVPAEGNFQATLSSFVLEQLASFSGIIDLGGLTEEKIQYLTGLQTEPFMEKIGDLYFRRLAINYVDNSLVNKIFEFNHQELDVPISDLKDTINRSFENWLTTFENLESTSDIATGFSRFIQTPTSITFDLSPETPVSFNAKGFLADESVFYNSLNMTLRFNQGGLYPIKFKVSDAEAIETGPDDSDSEGADDAPDGEDDASDGEEASE
jgi:hypothetical protein